MKTHKKSLKKNPQKKIHILMALAAISLGLLVIILSTMFLNPNTSQSDKPGTEQNSAQNNSSQNNSSDNTAPVITLNGEERIIISYGVEYVDPGFTATDDVDGDLTSSVVVETQLDTSKLGEYIVDYTVLDKNGNIGRAKRIVVVQTQSDEQAANPTDKVVYLSFDDGPGPYTQQLLDILDKYNVKVTFFVTNQTASCKDMIGEAYRRGHTIAMHSYTHSFKDIYSSESAYFNDLNKISALCEAQTGVKPTIIRFPGGTANGVSKKYCAGIMTTLTKSLPAKGYYYCDWNIDSKDAVGANTKEEIYNNVITGIQKYDVSYVLQHDIFKVSVEAVEDIILWGLENGYTFLPLTEESPMLHQKPNN